MIEYGEVDRFAGQREAPRDLMVGGARSWVAAGMVVGQDHAGAAVPRRVGNDLADRQFRAAIVAIMARQMDATCLVVDMSDPQMFLGGVGLGKAVSEESPRRVEAIEAQRGFGTLM